MNIKNIPFSTQYKFKVVGVENGLNQFIAITPELFIIFQPLAKLVCCFCDHADFTVCDI